MKKKFIILMLVVFITGCKEINTFKDDIDISNKVFVGTQVFETQEIAEFELNKLNIPYVVMDAGTTNYKHQLATIDSEYLRPKDGEDGFYVNKDETIVLKIHVFEEKEEEAPKEETPKEETPKEGTPKEETPKEETPKDTSSGYQEIYDKWAAEIKLKAPDVSTMELAEITNEGVAEMATYMYKAKGKDGQYETYEKWAGELMDLYMAEAR